jgi:hypothetical protein
MGRDYTQKEIHDAFAAAFEDRRRRVASGEWERQERRDSIADEEYFARMEERQLKTREQSCGIFYDNFPMGITSGSC